MTKLSAGDSGRRWCGRSVGGLVRVEGAAGAEEAGRVDDGSDGRQRVDDLTTLALISSPSARTTARATLFHRPFTGCWTPTNFIFCFGDRGDSMAARDGSVAREIGTP